MELGFINSQNSNKMLKSEEYGYLFKDRDSDLMVENVITVLSDEKLIAKIKKRLL